MTKRRSSEILANFSENADFLEHNRKFKDKFALHRASKNLCPPLQMCQQLIRSFVVGWPRMSVHPRRPKVLAIDIIYLWLYPVLLYLWCWRSRVRRPLYLDRLCIGNLALWNTDQAIQCRGVHGPSSLK